MTTLDELFALASQHHANGNLPMAEQLYRQVLQAVPHVAEVHSCLGVALAQQGKLETAAASLEQALRCRPDYHEAHNDLASVLQAMGNLTAAVDHYNHALRLQPANPTAHNNLAATLVRLGKLDLALGHYREALRLQPDYAAAHYNMGSALEKQGKLDEAVACYRQALDLQPTLVEAWNNLGSAFEKKGLLDQAVQSFQRALDCRPQYAEAHSNLGGVLRKQGNHAASIDHCHEAVRIQPTFASARVNLGSALQESGRLEEAAAQFREALRLDPRNAVAQTNLGITLMDLGMLDEAAACHQTVIDMDSHSIRAWINLGSVLERQKKLDEAISCYRRAMELQPPADVAVAVFNLGGVQRVQGKIDDALDSYRRALQLKPDYAEAHSNLVYALSFCPAYDAKTIAGEHRNWDRCHAEPLARLIQTHPNNRAADRRLRVGYVSPDFREHVVGRNLLPLLREHDQRQVEIVCYASVFRPDSFTERMRGHATLWRNITYSSDERVAQRIREDGIDILVDLSLHMAHNRLLVFARKPAPVQVTFAGYPGTTGLSAIDYRLTDPYLDPPDSSDEYYSEESIRLPDSFWCYDPETDAPSVTALPARANGFITFGCLNSFGKLNKEVFHLWALVLKAHDRSRLLMLAPEEAQRGLALKELEQEGIAAERISFVGHQAHREYLETYQRIDIGLDTFPYNGHTTSLDSFWMGVPVITLVGRTVVGRAGYCQLMNLGLPELIAESPAQFMTIAAKLSGDLAHLEGLRASLRSRMQKSPLMDAPRFARGIEAAYRKMWQRWCSGRRQP